MDSKPPGEHAEMTSMQAAFAKAGLKAEGKVVPENVEVNIIKHQLDTRSVNPVNTALSRDLAALDALNKNEDFILEGKGQAKPKKKNELKAESDEAVLPTTTNQTGETVVKTDTGEEIAVKQGDDFSEDKQTLADIRKASASITDTESSSKDQEVPFVNGIKEQDFPDKSEAIDEGKELIRTAKEGQRMYFFTFANPDHETHKLVAFYINTEDFRRGAIPKSFETFLTKYDNVINIDQISTAISAESTDTEESLTITIKCQTQKDVTNMLYQNGDLPANQEHPNHRIAEIFHRITKRDVELKFEAPPSVKPERATEPKIPAALRAEIPAPPQASAPKKITNSITSANTALKEKITAEKPKIPLPEGITDIPLTGRLKVDGLRILYSTDQNKLTKFGREMTELMNAKNATTEPNPTKYGFFVYEIPGGFNVAICRTTFLHKNNTDDHVKIGAGNFDLPKPFATYLSEIAGVTKLAIELPADGKVTKPTIKLTFKTIKNFQNADKMRGILKGIFGGLDKDQTTTDFSLQLFPPPQSPREKPAG